MKKFTFLFICLLFAGSVIGQNADQKWAIGFGPGFYYNLSESDRYGFMPELYFSRYLSPSFDLMLKGDLGVNKPDKLDLFGGFLNARYKFYNDKLISADAKVMPYLFAGPGLLMDNRNVLGKKELLDANKRPLDYKESNLTFNAGIGSKFRLSDAASLYLEAGYINGVDGVRITNTSPLTKSVVNDDFIKVTGIVEFAFGKAKDSDGDGVPDKRDKCPNTPPGVAVDADGCPLDRDGDGVPDYLDECPDTPGLKEFKGCPDRDGDGVPDHLDECPDVPGLKKFNGCPDSDGDGVPDHKDECPNTPKGCPVDEKGCPLDSDGDGVIDCEDECPNEPGPKENKGCPVGLIQIEIGPVYFDFDKSVLKPEGKAELDKLVQTLNASKKYEVVIAGHTCSIGSETYNQKLSERRAQEVVKYLTTKGINNAFVGSKGYGESQPAKPNTTNTNRSLNRRAEFDVKVQK